MIPSGLAGKNTHQQAVCGLGVVWEMTLA